ncbi:hypothetical protein LEP1GSC108_1088 [Leptospira weilii str. UI 13098]|uniref:Transposase domain protein n=1 Tax=Leptospira weilii str. UI 13098 TaxID=1088542 RepID=M6QIY6_9LEPT|nr:hypothetical protein LEP1GSC108_1088 [Leptospira weilii str. UI 13098]
MDLNLLELQNQYSTQVIVLNPGDLAMIYQSLKKTDKEDSLKIARLIQRYPKEEFQFPQRAP